MNEKHPSSPGNMEAPGKSNSRVPQHGAKTHGKWHVPSSWGEGLERGQNQVTSFTVSFILEKEINEGNFNINEVARK